MDPSVSPPRRLLGVHAIAVLAAIAFYLATDIATDIATSGYPSSAVGAGLSALPVLLLGLPWNVLVVWDPTGHSRESVPVAIGYYAVRIGSAVLNLFLHAALRRRPRP